MPTFHKVIRNFYDRYGYPISRHINSKWFADVMYLLMKPLEWFFLVVMVHIVVFAFQIISISNLQEKGAFLEETLCLFSNRARLIWTKMQLFIKLFGVGVIFFLGKMIFFETRNTIEGLADIGITIILLFVWLVALFETFVVKFYN